MNLSAILLATIGGFASLFTYLTHFQLRGYNRISIFIAFFSLLAIGFLFEKWREKWSSTQFKQVMFYVFMVIILGAGLLDQSPRPGAPNHNKVQYLQDKQFVKGIEANLPKNTMIFQLPYIPFPEHPPVHKMTDYEHFKGYLHSTHLRWSYGAPKGREGDLWQKQTAAKSPKELIETIIFAGFGGLWLDRFGYADNGVQIVKQFNEILEITPIESKDQRYVFWDLTNYTNKLKNNLSPEEWKQKTTEAILPIYFGISWGKGFSVEEKNDKNHWCWSEEKSELYFNNSSKNPITVVLSWKFVTPGDKMTAIKIEGDLINEQVINQTQNLVEYSKRIVVLPGRHKIKFSTTAKQLVTPTDPRKIFFGLHDYRLDVLVEYK